MTPKQAAKILKDAEFTPGVDGTRGMHPDEAAKIKQACRVLFVHGPPPPPKKKTPLKRED